MFIRSEFPKTVQFLAKYDVAKSLSSILKWSVYSVYSPQVVDSRCTVQCEWPPQKILFFWDSNNTYIFIYYFFIKYCLIVNWQGCGGGGEVVDSVSFNTVVRHRAGADLATPYCSLETSNRWFKGELRPKKNQGPLVIISIWYKNSQTDGRRSSGFRKAITSRPFFLLAIVVVNLCGTLCIMLSLMQKSALFAQNFKTPINRLRLQLWSTVYGNSDSCDDCDQCSTFSPINFKSQHFPSVKWLQFLFALSVQRTAAQMKMKLKWKKGKILNQNCEERNGDKISRYLGFCLGLISVLFISLHTTR